MKIKPKKNDPLYVCFLWHMHQPLYKNPENSDYLMPWVRLHAVKDYFDMLNEVLKYPDVKVTFNLVPSLVEQIKDYTEGRAEDEFLRVSRKEATTLTEDEKIFILKNFFSLDRENMIDPYPRYRWLYEKRGARVSLEELKEKIKNFNVNDFRDLQVWFNLAWSGNYLKEKENIKNLIGKGRNFSESDKRILFEEHENLMKKILPSYKKAYLNGEIEISTSPYYHPILPLLYDINSARESLPNVELPEQSFHYPEDAIYQIESAIRCFKSEFGREPAGMWPSEGSISEDILKIVAEKGFKWVATDETVLKNSFVKSGFIKSEEKMKFEKKFLSYRFGNENGVEIFFRDLLLSDMIGFTYSTYEGERAAEDLISRLLLIRKNLPEDEKNYVVPIILDGENAWERYRENGKEFFEALYSGLSENPFLKCVTFSEYLEIKDYNNTLPKVMAGSWIYGNFSTWIGQKEKNRAWELLSITRKKFEEIAMEVEKEGRDGEIDLKKAYRHILIGEGSDWFWWYGEDHNTEYDVEFDELFRKHLIASFRYMGIEPPDEFFDPIVEKRGIYEIQPPHELITPVLDGYITDYFEWLPAGFFTNKYTYTTMQRIHNIFTGFYFGFDRENLYIRVDVPKEILNDRKYPFVMVVSFRKPGNIQFKLIKDNKFKKTLFYKEILGANGEIVEKKEFSSFGVEKIVEVGIPFSEIGIRENQNIEFAISLYIGENLAERMPESGYVAQKISIDEFEKYYWVV